jgi:hypothetical protein
MIGMKYLCDYTIHVPIFSNNPTNKNICMHLVNNYRNHIIYCNSRKEGKAIAFVFPNTALPVEDLPKYATTVEAVEKITGINFMPKLPKEKAKIEKTKPDLSKWPKLSN